jgi:hypothetical protein
MFVQIETTWRHEKFKFILQSDASKKGIIGVMIMKLYMQLHCICIFIFCMKYVCVLEVTKVGLE